MRNEQSNKIIYSILLLFYLFFLSFLIANQKTELVFFVLIVTAGTLLLAYNALYGMFAIFLSANIFNPSLRIGFINIYAANALIIVTFIFLLLNRVTNRQSKFFHSNLELPLVIFVIISVLSIRQDTISVQAKRIMAYGIFMLSYIVTVNIISTKKELVKLLNYIFIASIPGALYVLYTFVFSPFRGAALRGYGAFVNPNAYGIYGLVLLPVIIYWGIYKKNPFYFFSTIIIGAAFVSTISRAAIFSLFFSFVLVNTFFKKNYWYFIFSLLLFIAIIFYPPVNERVQNILNFTDTSLLARVTLWYDAISQFKSVPFAGLGSGNFFGSALPYDSKMFNGAFNQFLTILAENGLVGFIVYLWLTLITLFYPLKLYFNSNNEFAKNMVLGILMSILAFQGLSMAEDPLMAIMSNWAYGVLLGILYILWRFEQNESSDNFSYLRS
ncbi:MAG: O-antigen ligase family protein [Candidatus Muiribacteriota bacterium]